MAQERRLALAYLRFSPRRDANLCESNECQYDYIKAYCAQRGYVLVGEPFADEEISGDDEHRVGLWNATGALRRGMVLVVYKSDRLERNVYLSEFIHREVRRKRATIEYVTGGGNGESAEEVFIRQVFAAFAEMERKLIASRTRAAQLRHQANGRAMSKIPPFGQRLGAEIEVRDGTGRIKRRRTLVTDDAEMELIERVIALARSPHASLRGIARQMNEEGHYCRGKLWGKNLVERILRRAGVKLANTKCSSVAAPAVSN